MTEPDPTRVPGFLETLAAYHYELPERLIAQRPAEPRDSSRLMVIHRKSGTWEHRRFSDLVEYLDANDLAVVNNTKVMKARLLGNRLRDDRPSDARSNEGRSLGESATPILGGRVEFVMLEEVAPLTWEGLFHASARYVAGVRFQIPTPDGHGLKGELIRGSADSPSGAVVARFDRDPITSGAGELPLPHYIREAHPSSDEHSYQTIYAKHFGSAAAPTAGLHFTDRVRAGLDKRGVTWEELTLHVGLGTFRPVKQEDVRQHVMHEERYEISEATAAHITEAKLGGRRVLAVGTTSVRTLESAWKGDHLLAGVGRTAIFIRPGAYQFQVVDRLLTNFHLPGSTLMMLVSAFASRDLILAAYQEAVRHEYRFFSYGDAMLIL